MVTTERPGRLRYAYVIIAAAVAVQLVGWGTFGTFGVFLNSLQSQFDASRAAVSGIASVVLIVHGLFSVVVGNLSDRIGPRLVVTACGAVFALGLLLTSRATSLWQAYLFYGVVVGMGVSALDVVVLSTIARWFTSRRGSANGIVKAGAGAGHLSIPLLAGLLIASLGWRQTYVWLAAVLAVFVVGAAQFLRRDPGSASNPSNGRRLPKTQIESGLSLRQASKGRQFWAVVAAYFAILFCTYTVQTHIAVHAMDLGSSLTKAAGFLSIIGASSIIGRFGMGVVGDKIGTRRAMMASLAVLCVALLSMVLMRQLWMLYLIIPIYGFAHGGTYSLISPMVAEMFGTASQGAIYGVVIFGGTIGGAVGPLLAGYMFDRAGNYNLVFFILSVVAAAGFLLVSALRPLALKEKQA